MRFFWQPPEPLPGPPCCQTPSPDVPAGPPGNTTCGLETEQNLRSHSNGSHHLVSCSDDKHPPQDEALAVHVALVTGPPGPYEVLPHSQSEEAQTPHPPPQGAVEVFLQTEATVSRARREAAAAAALAVAVPTCSSMKMSPAKCGLKSWISVPMFSFTTATRGTPSSSSWGFREDSSEASCGTAHGHRRASAPNGGGLGHLSAQESSGPAHRHDHGAAGLPQALRFDDFIYKQNRKFPFLGQDDCLSAIKHTTFVQHSK